PTTAKKEGSGSSIFASLSIVLCLVIAFLLWKFVMGSPSNFEGGDPENGHPLPGNYFGMVYKGGYVVPVLMGLFLMVIVFSFERFFVISKAAGKGNVDAFVGKVRGYLSAGNIDAAMAECDKQEGSVANVIKSGLKKYKEVEVDPNLDTEQSVLAIQKDIEEATALEMPMLEQNLTVIATLVSIGTLMGLLGTVTGMIKAFAALSSAGTPDQAQLANGISEALINTATGIATSALAIIMYNIFTSKIDKLTYSIDEAGFSIIQTYASTHK
ncbi:MAG TPA: MotA/TolQ/ExbB proton channel family protein, partial [Sphingobacteriaceae bacterium]